MTLNNLEEADSLEKLGQLIVNSVEKHLQDYPVEGKLFLRLKLEGRCPMYRELAAPENLLYPGGKYKSFLVSGYLELEYEGLTPPLCPENYKQGPHIFK